MMRGSLMSLHYRVGLFSLFVLARVRHQDIHSRSSVISSRQSTTKLAAGRLTDFLLLEDVVHFEYFPPVVELI